MFKQHIVYQYVQPYLLGVFNSCIYHWFQNSSATGYISTAISMVLEACWTKPINPTQK